MIKAFLLLIRPVQTWEAIARTERSIGYVLMVHLLPLILLTGIAEGYGLMHWGKHQKGESVYLKHYPLKEVIVIETAQTILLIGVVFIGAQAAKTFAGTFQRRFKFNQGFAAIAYGMAPLITLRLGDLSATLNPWIPWAVGMVLTLAVLYYGLPCVLRPDPPHAFGLYVMTSLTLVVVNALLRLVTSFFFAGKLHGVESVISSLVGNSPS